jgi:hypothetical protein
VIIAFGTGCASHDEPREEDTQSTSPTPAPVEHVITIATDGTICKLTDANGNIDVGVKPGEWVIWVNNFGSDVELTFGTQRLFGVRSAIAYASASEEPLRLKVRRDAVLDTHKYNTNCGTTLPPPGIVVNPPGGGG